MKKVVLAAVFTALASTAFAGGVAEPIMEPEVIQVETAKSNNTGILVAVLAILFLAATAK